MAATFSQKWLEQLEQISKPLFEEPVGSRLERALGVTREYILVHGLGPGVGERVTVKAYRVGGRVFVTHPVQGDMIFTDLETRWGTQDLGGPYVTPAGQVLYVTVDGIP